MAWAIMEKNGIEVEVLRPVDDDIAYGVGPAIRMHRGAWGAWSPRGLGTDSCGAARTAAHPAGWSRPP